MPPAMALNPHAPSWMPGTRLEVAPSPRPAVENLEEGCFPLQALPEEVVSSILEHTAQAGGLKDVLSAGTACKDLLNTLAGTGLSLRTELPTSASSAESAAYISGMAHSLEQYMPGVRALDVRSLPLENLDALWLAASPSLPRLSILDASSCRKLTPWLPEALGAVADASRVAHAAAGPSSTTNATSAALPATRLRALSLQRCFQLGPGCLTHLLRAASAPGGLPLVTLSLSHLELGGWPLLGPGSGTLEPATSPANGLLQGGSSSGSSGQPSAPTSLAGSMEGCSPGAGCMYRPKVAAVLGAVFDAAGAGARERVRRAAVAQQAAGNAGSGSSSSAASDKGNDVGVQVEEEDEGQRPELEGESDSIISDEDEEDTFVGRTHIGSAAQALLAALCAPGSPCAGPSLGLPTTQLRVLALNNCTKLSGLALITLALTCPRLQLLLLGGCNLESQYVAQGLHAPASTGTGADTGSDFELPQAVVRAQRAAAAHVAASFVSSGRRDPGCPDAAVELLVTALCLPELAALELTCMPPSVVACVRACLAQLRPLGGAAVTPATESQMTRVVPYPGCGTAVWDLSQPKGTEGALAALRAARKASDRASSSGGGLVQHPSATVTTTWPAEQPLALGLRCSANASNASRSGPLHFAAERGDTSGVCALLELGAIADARERGGCTPLFLACEAGHAGAAEALLPAGADAQLSNAAGESPLYISSLRGHLGVVRVLLRHFAAKGLAWLEPWHYGDSWTPLMAAAVANRHDVALALLLAAGPVGARLLVSAVNRYGQSVMHIAARKGSQQLLRLLLEHTTAGKWNAHDTGGDTPMDVARKNGHHVALTEFTRALSGARLPSHASSVSQAAGAGAASAVAVAAESLVTQHHNVCGSGAVAAAKAAQAAASQRGTGVKPSARQGPSEPQQKSSNMRVPRHAPTSQPF